MQQGIVALEQLDDALLLGNRALESLDRLLRVASNRLEPRHGRTHAFNIAHHRIIISEQACASAQDVRVQQRFVEGEAVEGATHADQADILRREAPHQQPGQ